jgi:hypothetical protein
MAILVGCGQDNGLAPVKGRVLLDEQPLDGAAVMFQPVGGGVPATATTDSKGEFEMMTAQAKGAALGENKVSVAKQVIAAPNRKVEESEIVPMKSLTPPKYASPQTSGISVDVKRGMEPVELKLISK